MERFVIVINGWKQLTIITKRSTLDVTADLDPPLMPSVHIGMIFALDRGWEEILQWCEEKKNHVTMLFIFHAKLKRGVQTYICIKQRQNFVLKK